MPGALEVWDRIASSIIRTGRKPRMPIKVSDDRPPPVKPQKDYVGLRINELFLRDAREWFTTIEPVVYASTEFLYGGVMRTDPFVVGPRKNENLPSGMVMQNISVFGPHPYRGGKLTYSIVLAQLPTKNVARDLLDIIESTGKALDPSSSLSTWTKLSGVVLNGFDRLMKLADVQPLIGVRREHDPDADGPLQPSHFALIDIDDPDASTFWVKDGTLVHGSTQSGAKPYRDAGFVLYEITSAVEGRRNDTDRLAFHPLWERALEAAGKPGADAWAEAKGNMAALASALFRSPDLTFDQANFLRDNYLKMLTAVHTKAKELEKLSGAVTTASPAVRVDDILRLS